MIYYKIDMTHPAITGILEALTAGFRLVRPDNVLSVTVKPDGTEAWVKLINDVNLDAIPGAVLDMALGFDQHRTKVQTDIYSPEWQTEEEDE